MQQLCLSKEKDKVEVSFGGSRKQPYIYITDSLTPYNGQLLADAKKIAKELDYEFIGYTNNKGEVRVKKPEECDPISVLCRQDLAKIIQYGYSSLYYFFKNVYIYTHFFTNFM